MIGAGRPQGQASGLDGSTATGRMISFQPVRTGPCPGSPSQSHTKALAIFKTISTVGFASLAILQGFRRVLRQHRLPAVSTFAITVSDEIGEEELSGFTHRSATPRHDRPLAVRLRRAGPRSSLTAGRAFRTP